LFSSASPADRRRHHRILLLALAAVLFGAASGARAEPVDFKLPAQPADDALMAFSRQANVEILFSFDELHGKMSSGVSGRMEPGKALEGLLKGTGFEARMNGKGRYVVALIATRTGAVRGRLLTPKGAAAAGIRVIIPDARLSAYTDTSGGFYLGAVPAGRHQLVATGGDFQALVIDDLDIAPDQVLTLETFSLAAPSDGAKMAPFVVEAKTAIPGPLGDGGAPPAPRTAAGDVDMPRTSDDALDFEVFTREEIQRSGVIDLNQFLQRELINSDATTLPPEENASVAAFASGSSNLNMGGYSNSTQQGNTADATIVLVNGRRLPEIVTALPANFQTPQAPQPDVNVIPINLIERIEVLPVSASALYSGSPVGGVINIVLRPNVNTTELTTTYTNSLSRFDAPQSTTSLLHGETLLGGKLQVRMNATFTQVDPPTEAELGYIRQNLAKHPVSEDELFRATPNVSSSDGSPLFGPGTSPETSVAPGANGQGGLAAFLPREGVQSLALFAPPGGGLADSPNSIDYPYGRKEQVMSVYGSVNYDVTPWLQVGIDATANRTVNNTGYGIFTGNLVLPAASPFNPFGQDVNVTLNEMDPKLGADYDEAHISYYSVVGGLLMKFGRGWEISADAQYGLDITRYRGIEGVVPVRWQDLVNEGIYNPLRDTQVVAAPRQFYQQALVFFGPRGTFAPLGDYNTIDASLRVANASISLPTGISAFTLGADYQYASLATYTEDLRYGDGTLVAPPDIWVGRSLVRYSTFGELQAPVVPSRFLPPWILKVETDLAGRYTASSLANEANFAPTGALKIDFAGGLSLRATYATSNRFPPDVFSREEATAAGSQVGGIGQASGVEIFDPRRGNELETVQAGDAVNPNLQPEAAVTQTAGFIYQKGTTHRFRLSVDFVDANTSGENVYLGAQQLVDLESLYPKRVIREAPAPGDPFGVGVITNILTGNFNAAWRHSENWNTSLDYAWTGFMGGTLEAYCRWAYYQKYELEVVAGNPPVDELRHPDGATPGLLRQRMNLGANWSNKRNGFGIDVHYFHSRILPVYEWAEQGSNQVDPYWQFDGFAQTDLGRWLPWASPRYSIRGQIRVDNLFNGGPPKYAEDPSGAGVQPYGDWRGRVFSASVTLTF
jgi:outer membrane receptor protein involved in Fe transport